MSNENEPDYFLENLEKREWFDDFFIFFFVKKIFVKLDFACSTHKFGSEFLQPLFNTKKNIFVLTFTGERDRRDSFGDRDRFLSSRDRDLRRDSFAGVRDRLRSRESPRDSRVESLRSLE